MEETKFIWFNGKMQDWSETKVHFLTHSLHYGTAVFEGIRAYETEKGPAVFRLKEHMKRLEESAHIVGMKIPYTVEELCKATKEVIKKNGVKSCYIRPLVFYGYGKMGLATNGATIDVGIAIWPWGAYLGEEGKTKGIRAKVSSYTRPYINSTMIHAKVSGTYANSTLAKMEVINAGYEEAIMLDKDGFVAECSGENIFVIKDGEVITPPSSVCLKGITRDSVIKILADNGIKVLEKQLTRDELYSADGIFITGTAAEVTPIREVDNRTVGNGSPEKITKMVQQKYDEIIHGGEKKYISWLDFV
jgi:branched-chain amino acid aminotransferase